MKVGKPAQCQDFVIHKDLVTSNSQLFASALSRNWKEGRSGVVSLPEDDPDAFEIYVSWLYKRSPFTSEALLAPSSEQSTSLSPLKQVERFISAYLLGDKLLDDDFCDMIIDALLEYSAARNAWPTKQAERIFLISPPESPQRNLLPDIVVHRGNAAWFNASSKNILGYSSEALIAITRGLLLSRGKNTLAREAWPWVVDPCVYHRHKKTQKQCYKTMPGLDKW